MFRLLRVDMDGGRAVYEDIPSCFAGMGGRGLAASILARECSPGRLPFEPCAKLVFAPGLLGATRALSRNRLAAGCINPETGGLQSAVSTSRAATDLLRLGILGIIIENGAPQGPPLQLEIRENGARLAPSPVAGLGIGAAMAELRRIHGASCSIALIGPAGEAGLSVANIAFSLSGGAPPRRAGRGMGALMGARGLKNIVVFPPDEDTPPMANPDAYARAAVRLGAVFAGLSAGFRRLSRPGGERGEEEGKPDARAGEREMPTARAGEGKGRGGKHCSQACGLCEPSVGKGRGLRRRESAAYGALWNAAGGGAGALRARFDAVCDEMGVDVFAVSDVAAVGMEKGALREGDTAAVIEAVESIASGAQPDWLSGPVFAVKPSDNAEKTNASADDHAPGGDHAPGEDHAPGGEKTGRRGREAGSEERASAFADAMGLCVYAAPAVLGDREVREALASLLDARYGWELPPDYALSLGERIVKMEEEFLSAQTAGTRVPEQG